MQQAIRTPLAYDMLHAALTHADAARSMISAPVTHEGCSWAASWVYGITFCAMVTTQPHQSV